MLLPTPDGTVEKEEVANSRFFSADDKATAPRDRTYALFEIKLVDETDLFVSGTPRSSTVIFSRSSIVEK